MGRRLLACAASGVTAAAVAAAANQRAAGAQHGSRWMRTNFAGKNVTLAEGPIAVIALLAGAGVDRLLDPSGRRGLPVAVASVGAALVGAYDDLYGSSQAKGFGSPPGAAVWPADQRDDQDRGRRREPPRPPCASGRSRPGCSKPVCRVLGECSIR